MNDKLTDITLVLDRSSSMNRTWDATLSGVNEFIETQKGVDGDCNLTLIFFSDHYNKVRDAVPIEQVSELTRSEVSPSGSTALLGAMGRAIQETGERLAAMPEAERPSSVILVVMTDGEENMSHMHEWSQIFTHEKVMADLKRQEEEYNWNVIFLGANQDAIAVGQSFGVRAANCMTYAQNDLGTDKAYAALATNVKTSRMTGDAKALNFSAAQREVQKNEGAHQETTSAVS